MASQIQVADDPSVEVPTMSEAAARRLTRQINEHYGRLEQAVLAAYRGRVWEAMGYGSWAAYVDAELDMSRSNSHRLIAQAEAINEVAAVTGSAHAPLIARTITARQAAALRQDMPASVTEIAAAVESGTPVTVAVREAVARRTASSRQVLAAVSHPVEEEAQEDEIDLMGICAALREQLRMTFAELSGYLRSAPKAKDEAQSEDELTDEMIQWLDALSPLTASACQERLFDLQAELYRVLKRTLGPGGRGVIAERVGLTKEAVDYLIKSRESAFDGL